MNYLKEVRSRWVWIDIIDGVGVSLNFGFGFVELLNFGGSTWCIVGGCLTDLTVSNLDYRLTRGKRRVAP
jgi:hypothetical protein